MKGSVIFIIISLSLCVAVLAFLIWEFDYGGNAFASQLQSNNVKVIKGFIDSPSVIIIVDETSFMQKADQIGTVYRDGLGFYVFVNSEQTIAWQYNVPLLT